MFQSKNIVFGSLGEKYSIISCLTIAILIISCISPNTVNAQSTTSHGFSSIRSLSLGNTGVAHMGIESIFDNQAAAAFLDESAIIAGAKSSFTQVDLNQYGAGAALKMTNAAVGIELNANGSDEYSERKIGVFYARSLSKRIAIAGQINYFGLAISEHGQASALSFEVAAISKISNQINIGIHLYSPIEVKFADAITLPSIFTAGIEYLISDGLRLSAELEKDLNQSESIQMGIEYSPIDPMYVRLGFRTNPTEFSFGIGLKVKSNFNIDIGSHWHQVLGFSPGVGLSYRFNKPAPDVPSE